MSFLPRFNFTTAMVRNLGIIESARAVIDILPLPPDRVLSLRQAARRRATRNSTGIEGNTLNGVEIDQAVVSVGRTHTLMQQEVRNYWRALEWTEQQQEARRPISEEFICELHSIILVRGQGRRGTRSVYRETECPVVDSGTRRIDYGPPTPQDVPALMRELVAWWQGPAAAELTGPIRAGLLAHRFVSIHPFDDGNGRTARALATAELWRSGYDMRGFLSLEEHYASDLKAYYDNLQMGLPVNFYEGRHDPDHTPWLEYFVGTMAHAAEDLHKKAIALYDPARRPIQPWERLHRVQQQLLSRLMLRGQEAGAATPTFVPSDVVEWFGVSAQTAREWLGKWRDDGFVQPAKGGVQRVRAYVLAPEWAGVLGEALDSVADKDG